MRSIVKLLKDMEERQSDIVFMSKSKDHAIEQRQKALGFIMTELGNLRRDLMEIAGGSEMTSICDTQFARGRKSLAEQLIEAPMERFETTPEKCPKCGEEDSLSPLLSHDPKLDAIRKCSKCAYECIVSEEGA